MKNELKTKFGYIAVIGVMGLVPPMSYVQPPFDHPVIISEFSSQMMDDVHKAIIPPFVCVDATATFPST